MWLGLGGLPVFTFSGSRVNFSFSDGTTSFEPGEGVGSLFGEGGGGVFLMLPEAVHKVLPQIGWLSVDAVVLLLWRSSADNPSSSSCANFLFPCVLELCVVL